MINRIINRIKHSSPYHYIKLRISNFFEKNTYVIKNKDKYLIIEKVQIKSLFFKPINNNNWTNFLNLFINNSNKVIIKTHHPLLDVPIWGNFEIGGFVESIVIEVIASITIEALLTFIKKVLHEFKSSNDKDVTQNPGSLEWPGDIKIKFKTTDDKSIEIDLPYPIQTNRNISIDDVETIIYELNRNNHIKLSLSSEINKGLIIDRYN